MAKEEDKAKREELEFHCKANKVATTEWHRHDFLVYDEDKTLDDLRAFVKQFDYLPGDTTITDVQEYEGRGIAVVWEAPIPTDALEAALDLRLKVVQAQLERSKEDRRKQYLKLKAEFEPTPAK